MRCLGNNNRLLHAQAEVDGSNEQQHENRQQQAEFNQDAACFRPRFGGYPVVVAPLSRSTAPLANA